MDVEGVVPVSATKRSEQDVEPSVGIVSVHGVVAYGEVGVDIMRKFGVEVGMRNLRYCCDERLGLFS